MKDRQKYSGVIKSTFTVLKDNSRECFKVNVTYFTLKKVFRTTIGQTQNLPKICPKLTRSGQSGLESRDSNFLFKNLEFMTA